MNASPARRSPYKGLIPYAEGDAPFFFGREKETRLIIANMFASPLTLLYGASGVGKSSVLRAGVAHELRQRDNLIVVPFSTWQGNSSKDLVKAIGEYAKRADSAAWDEAGSYLNSALSAVAPPPLPEYLQACYEQMGRRFMIILDQFEEYFLYHSQEDIFAEELPKAVLQSQAPVSFLISIREDSLARLDRFEGRIPTLFDNYLRIEHLNYGAARDAIEKPIAQYNAQLTAAEHVIGIEPALVNAVLEQVQTGVVIIGETGRGVLKTEVATGQVETPFLQMVMTRLWDEEMRAGSHRLRLATLETLGGAERIVRTHLDETMNALSPDRQNNAAEVFHYLVTPSGTKIAHTIPDLAEYARLPRKQLALVLEELASGDTRILRGIEPPPDQPGETRYEIFHDVLAAAILDWRARHMRASELTTQQLKLAAERQRTNRLRLALLGLGALLILMIGLTSYALRQRRNALAAQEQAATDRNRALKEATLAGQRQREAEDARGKTAIALTSAQNEKNRANTQAELATNREKEANLQKARAEKQTSLAKMRLDVLKQAATEEDPEKVRSLIEKGAGIKPLTAEQERRKVEAERLANSSGRLLVRTPKEHGLRLWANGATLRVKFLEAEHPQQEFVKKVANEWTQYANIRFDFVTKGNAEIRITLMGGNSYSFVGTDALGIPQKDATMGLGAIVDNFISKSDKRGYILHEFGTMLGLLQEVSNPNANIPWDREKVYETWGKGYADMVFFTKPNIEYRPFDPTSVMMSPISPTLTGGRFEAKLNNELSNSDKEFIAKLYPRTN